MATGREPAGGSWNNPFEDETFEEIHSAECSRIQSEKELYEKRMLESSKRSLRLIEESKETACNTEVELHSQEESLLRTEKTLDQVNGDLDVTNRHITSLKSIWGTLGNYFRKPIQPKKPEEPASSSSNKSQTRPTVAATSSGWEERKDVYDSRPSDVNAVLDRNLDSMMSGLTELKEHALLFSDTLDRHDDIIERVTYKATVADTRIEDSDKKIRQILKK